MNRFLLAFLILLLISNPIHAEVKDISDGLEIKLTWQKECVDLDLYVFNPDGQYCAWGRCFEGAHYDYDSMGGCGRREQYGFDPEFPPFSEQITVNLTDLQANPGRYQIGVNYYTEDWPDSPVGEHIPAMVTLYQYGQLVNTFPLDISWPDENIPYSDWTKVWEGIIGETTEIVPDRKCTIYGVNDGGQNESTFFSIDAQTHEISILSNWGKQDAEALDAQPISQTLFTTSSNQSEKGSAGLLYKVQENELVAVGQTQYDSIDSLSFNQEGTLYGWAKTAGLVTIDTLTGQATLQSLPTALNPKMIVEDISFNPVGDKLYLAENNKVGKITTLWVYHLASAQVEPLCQWPGKVEALEMITDSILLLANSEEESDSAHIIALDVNNHCSVEETISLPPTLKDVEGLAWVCQ